MYQRTGVTGIATSLVFFAIGAVLYWAVQASTSGVDINTIGLIVMIVAAAGLVLSLGGFFFSGTRRRDTIVRDPAGTVSHATVREREVV